MKLGIIGTGKIVHEALFALEPVQNIEKEAIFARPHSQAKAEELAKKYNIAQIYTDYEELLAKADVECVYIGLVNSAHYSYAKAALLAGKHVILEKPYLHCCRGQRACRNRQRKGTVSSGGHRPDAQ